MGYSITEGWAAIAEASNGQEESFEIQLDQEVTRDQKDAAGMVGRGTQ